MHIIKELSKVKRRSAKKLPYLSAGLLDPSLSLRSNVVPSLKSTKPSEGVKRMGP